MSAGVELLLGGIGCSWLGADSWLLQVLSAIIHVGMAGILKRWIGYMLAYCYPPVSGCMPGVLAAGLLHMSPVARSASGLT
jgi:hypothetical protein